MSHQVDSVDILVVSWNGRRHLETLLPALEAQRDPGAATRIRLFDNGSTDGTAAWLRSEHPGVDLVEHATNLGFSAANNRLAESSSADALVLVNNDTRPRPDWLAELVAALRAAPPDVAALSGCIVDWEGERLDFGRGVMAFDGHAFQLDYGRLLEAVETPAEGAELLFPCGGNMIARRDAFLSAGGFDESYFAYLEDVDLGWRFWSGGERVLSAPRAVVHHRSKATSNLLGNANRGLLFERNAYFTAFKNYDAELWPQLMPAVQLTLLARTQHLLARCNPNGDVLALDPFRMDADGSEGTSGDRGVAPRTGPAPRGLWQRARDVVALRTRLRRVARRLGGLPAGAPAVVDDQAVAQLRALSAIVRGLDGASERRRLVQARRRRPDREILERFPLYVVPTYPGDEQLFASEGFLSLWPEDLAPVRLRLDDVMEVER
ncbi:MAG: glycosyltransferase family 2 protein [Acidobacteriota bacterium]|nr:glycosyltransferase family 2 protein [Acidobacteriota bacterium]MDE3266604.1 glycosyltransferase family 2 protein [Acidobacteriota bacterium]